MADADTAILDRPGVRRVAATGCVLFFVVASAVSIALLYGWTRLRQQHRQESAEYAARVTGLPLQHATILKEQDDAELSVQLFGRVELSVAAAIARDLPRAEAPERWPGREFFREEVVGRLPPPTGDSVLYGIHGCRPGNEWFGYLEPATGTFWLEILYPDWGGDPPGCNPPPWEHD